MSEGLNPIRRFISFILRNPINILCVLALGFCAFEAYILKNDTTLYQMIMVGIVAVWVFLFIAKSFFRIVVLLLIAGAIACGWFYYTGRDKAACEEKGGFWNKNTMTCEEKVPLLDRIGKLLKNIEK